MKIKIQLAFGILILCLITLSGCHRKGCTDKNADNYDDGAKKNDGSCTYRYSSGILVSASTSTNWDSFDGPDLFVRFAKQLSSTWDYVSSQGSNANSTSLTVPSAMFTNETWQFEIWDYDTLDPDDLVASGTFNPLTSGSGGNITISSGGTSITFQYSLK